MPASPSIRTTARRPDTARSIASARTAVSSSRPRMPGTGAKVPIAGMLVRARPAGGPGDERGEDGDRCEQGEARSGRCGHPRGEAAGGRVRAAGDDEEDGPDDDQLQKGIARVQVPLEGRGGDVHDEDVERPDE